ncbi:T9SS type A sorting domain-containing protein [Winogradskyella alexanderae]|uniref:T9SS type A sorting domain-containing protein n=1 Tax=Winogradskyella alexanderae TaxID=2877123 RepID=A0ABS7XQR3_9FLAO|nr:T9SS type A sorting domain-containing protein [Winogradskyella alexanderae]MCA0132340.1 T9SS type A sorting domain-containing protein [Winogradskyella alexanderae]
MHYKLIKQSIFLGLISLFFVPFLNAQSDDCGFKFTEEEQNYYDSKIDQIKALETEFLQNQSFGRNSNLLSSVPIKAHIIRQSDGTGGLTEIQLNDAIATMNSIYVSAGLEFFLCDGINYINNDDYYTYESSEEGLLTSVNNVNGVINIYFTNSITSSSGGSLCGYAYFPGGPETILMANSCTTNGSTLAHEMGHFFALPHTHGNSNVFASTEELVDGTNCESTGDFICDTPADPKLGFNNVNTNCDYTDFFSQDANGDVYQPDPLNIMSYSRKQCRTLFSPQQFARINAVYQISRSSMACPSFSTDFVADETESCGSDLTVNFTDNSVGATTWSWDINGDAIEDYNTQNITHTYNGIGTYDVALTVSNGTQTISKVKSQYINVGAQEISTITIELSLTLDDWPTETTWSFSDGDGNVLYSGGPYVEGIDDFTTKTETFTVNPDVCYKFEINDSYGDGICCASGNGNYQLRAADNTLLASGGDFGNGTSNNFFNGVLSIDDFSTEDIRLWPNPTSNTLTVNTTTLPDRYEIYNTLGQKIKASKVVSNLDLNISVEDLKEGIYFIKLTRDNSSQVLSFVKQ